MDPTNNEQTEILRHIWNEMKALNGRIDKTNERIDHLAHETRCGFEALGQRVEQLVHGVHFRDHADLRARVERIEDHLGIGRP